MKSCKRWKCKNTRNNRVFYWKLRWRNHCLLHILNSQIWYTEITIISLLLTINIGLSNKLFFYYTFMVVFNFRLWCSYIFSELGHFERLRMKLLTKNTSLIVLHSTLSRCGCSLEYVCHISGRWSSISVIRSPYICSPVSFNCISNQPT